MKSKISLSLSVLSLCLLQACGGGGGGGGGSDTAAAPGGQPSQPSPPVSSNTGSVTAPFARGETGRYMLLGVGSQSFGRLTESEQAASGAMTRLNDTTLTGSSSTREIGGDADFALGRWAAGTVTSKSGAETLTGSDNRAYHYLALNALAELPTTGSASCDAGAFTSPTNTKGANATTTSAAAAGNPTISFGADGASVAGTLTVKAGSGSSDLSLNAKITSPTSLPITGSFLSSGPGAALQLGRHGKSGYVLAVGYAAKTATDALYTGVALFRCG